jgi:1-deoxy-D-xylulose-5-phosphate synthase
VFAEALISEAERDKSIVAITAAMPSGTGLDRFGKRFPERTFDVGIAEQHAVTAAAGMAMHGLRPVVAIYSTFLNRAWDQVVHDVGLHRLPVVFCVDRAGITGDDGPSHHGVYDLALLTKVPGMTVFAPSSYAEVGVMLREALRITSGPVALRWPKTPAAAGDGVGTGTRARRVLEGRDLCILAVGKMVEAAREAAEILAVDAIRPTIWDVRAVPLDERMLTAAARFPLVVTVEDGIAEGGIGSLITSALARRRDDRGPRVVVLGTPLAYLPHGKVADLLAQLGLDGAGIAAAAVKALRDLERAGGASRRDQP